MKKTRDAGIYQTPVSRRFPKGGWAVRYRDADGRTTRRTFEIRKEALDFKGEVRTDIRRGDWIDPRKAQTRFREVAEEWLKGLADKKPKTLAGYRFILNAHVLPVLGDKPIGRITPGALRGLLAGLDRQPSTKRNVLRVISPILNLAMENGMRRDNPARLKSVRAAVGKLERKDMKVLDADQVAVLAEAISPEYRTLIYFAAYTGCRAGEIGALRVRHLNLMDLNRARVTIEESIADVSGQLYFDKPKNGETRSFGIPRFLAEMLVQQTAGKDRDDFVFPGAKGGPLRHSHFYARVFKPAVQKVLPELDGFRFHDLRHTCASICISLNIHPKVISDRLGHKSVAITMDVYGHLFPKDEAKVNKALDKTFKAAVGNGGPRAAEVVAIRT